MHFCKYAKTKSQIRAADKRLCLRYIKPSTNSRIFASSVAVQPGLCRTWSETPKICFERDAYEAQMIFDELDVR